MECRAWASNVKYVGGTLNRAGSVTFEIQVDGAYENPSLKTAKSAKIEATIKPENKTDAVPTTLAPASSSQATTTVVNASTI